MIRKISNILISSAIMSVALILTAFIISYFVTYPPATILFIAGAIPIVIFGPGLFSGSTSGVIHTPKVIYRLVDSLGPHKKRSPTDGSRSRFEDSLSWVLAGLITWIVSYFI
jgi:hypothetical protein